MLASPVTRPLLFALALVCLAAAAHAQDAARATIETTGESTVGARPDFALVTIGVQSVGKTAQAALADNSKATAAVIETLKGAGVDAKDIQTSDFSIWPRMSNLAKNNSEPPAILGYAVANRVTVDERDLARLGEVLDKVVAAGANAINGVQFGVSNASALLDEARKAAFADAKRKAEVYAAEAGAKLGALTELDETGAAAPVYARHAVALSAAAPIEAGENKLSVSVHARFEIAPGASAKP